MSDDALRALEREITLDPAALDLRRKHAQELLRAGHEERGLGALDLAWRLGADDLWDDLRARLEARTFEVRTLEMRYVPGGPFAMGSDELDLDARPLHLVNLSAFYVAAKPLTYGALEGWSDAWFFRQQDEVHKARFRPLVHELLYQQAIEAVAWFGKALPRPGRWTLVSEAQWERVFRASHFRRDRMNLYGVTADVDRPEWTADVYAADAYGGGPRRDPVIAGASGMRVVRGVPKLPAPVFALYREAADLNGRFSLDGRIFSKSVTHENGIAARPVFVPDPPAP